jgi:hypothetical protein
MSNQRDRMQNLFDALPPTDPASLFLATESPRSPIRSSRDYWLDRSSLVRQVASGIRTRTSCSLSAADPMERQDSL